ncbi:hypothetical protein [Streptomyces griseus]|uniref:hypothetical protein n=1 Tax=Streptomyces griseus TaxID=1911 RepID=UPI0037A6233D
MNGGHRSRTNPRLPRGLVRFTASDAYVLEGGPSPAAFTGPGAQDVLPELCDLLDGTRSVSELATLLDLSTDDVDAAVATLAKQGLLEHVGRDRAVPDTVPAPVFDFLSRNTAFTGRVSSAEEAAERLARATVLVAGRGALADTLVDILADCGVRTEPLHDGGLPTRWAERAPERTDGWIPSVTVVGLLDGTPAVRRPLTEAHEAGLAWLAAGIGAGEGFVGPLTHRDHGCLSCTLDQLPGFDSPLTPLPALVGTIGGTVAADLIHALTGTGHVRASRQVIDVRWEEPDSASDGGLDISGRTIYRRPSCPSCGDPRLPREQLLPWRYEQDIADPPPHFWAPAVLRNPPDTKALEESDRSLPTCPSLPASDARLHPAILELTELLGATSGPAAATSRTTGVRRIVPTAGNLTSAQAFVVSRHPVTGLDSNAAWFDARADRLVASGRVTSSEAAALFADLGLEPEHDRIVVWVGMVGKLATKYQDLALRLVHLDAGVVLTHAALTAQARGMSPLLVPRWDTAPVGAVLDLDSASETVTGIMAFGEVPA